MYLNTSGRDAERRDASAGASCSVGSVFTSLFSGWLGGSIFGAALMYLFDPDSGNRRRDRLFAVGEGALDSARDSAGSFGERVSDAFSGATGAASDAGGRLSDAAAYAARHARKSSSHWFGRARDTASDLYDRGADLYDDASDGASSRYRRGSKSLSRAYDRAADYTSGLFARDDGHHAARTAGVSVGTGLLCAAVGVGLMYFFDPRQGNRRRALLRDRFTSLGAQSRGVARSSRQYATHLGNQARGVAHDARQMVKSREPVPDDKLVARVRSVMGRCVSRAGALQVAASNGNVVLSGPLPASEVDGLLACVREVPGVASVENRLQVQGAEQPVGA